MKTVRELLSGMVNHSLQYVKPKDLTILLGTEQFTEVISDLKPDDPDIKTTLEHHKLTVMFRDVLVQRIETLTFVGCGVRD